MKKLVSLLVFLSWCGVVFSQTATNPQVWGCNSNCTNVNNGAWLPRDPAPAYVAATVSPNVATGSPATCRNFWNVGGAMAYRTSASVKASLAANPSVNVCVAARRSTSEDTTLPASLVFGNLSAPPVNCEVSAWSAWSEGPWSACIDGSRSRTDQRTRTVVTQPANGGTACPALVESQTVTEACAPPPPPRTSVVISVSSQRVYTNEPVVVSWTSQNATSCTASWSTGAVPTAGQQSLSMSQPMAFARVWVRCIGAANEYEAGTGFVVLSRAPDCYAHDDRETDRDKVKVRALSLSNLSLRYQIMAVWWCRMPDGAAQQQRFVLGVQDQETIADFRKWLDRQFDEAGVRARCEQNCEVLPPGALKDELDAWASLPENSAAVIGVIEP